MPGDKGKGERGMTIRELILELANYHWPGSGKFPSGFGAEVRVGGGRDGGGNSITEAGWVEEREYNEGASSSPIIRASKLPGGFFNSERDHPRRRMLALKALRRLVDEEMEKCQVEVVLEDIKLGRIGGYRVGGKGGV